MQHEMKNQKLQTILCHFHFQVFISFILLYFSPIPPTTLHPPFSLLFVLHVVSLYICKWLIHQPFTMNILYQTFFCDILELCTEWISHKMQLYIILMVLKQGYSLWRRNKKTWVQATICTIFCIPILNDICSAT